MTDWVDQYVKGQAAADAASARSLESQRAAFALALAVDRDIRAYLRTLPASLKIGYVEGEKSSPDGKHISFPDMIVDARTSTRTPYWRGGRETFDLLYSPKCVFLSGPDGPLSDTKRAFDVVSLYVNTMGQPLGRHWIDLSFEAPKRDRIIGISVSHTRPLPRRERALWGREQIVRRDGRFVIGPSVDDRHAPTWLKRAAFNGRAAPLQFATSAITQELLMDITKSVILGEYLQPRHDDYGFFTYVGAEG